MKNLEIWNEFDNSVPIIVSIQHSGTNLTMSMRKDLLDNVILSNMDWYLIELYSFLKKLHITTIVNNISRYVIDTNREIVDNSSDSYTKNYIYTKTTFGYEIYKNIPSEREIKNRIQKYYNAYHENLSKLIKYKLKKFNRIYLIDLHSFGKDINEDIVLGNANGETSSDVFINNIKENLEKHEFIISLNKQYSGGYIVKKYAGKNIETIQIELSYKKYIANRTFKNEEFPEKDMKLFYTTQQKPKKAFEEIITKI